MRKVIGRGYYRVFSLALCRFRLKYDLTEETMYKCKIASGAQKMFVCWFVMLDLTANICVAQNQSPLHSSMLLNTIPETVTLCRLVSLYIVVIESRLKKKLLF